MKKYDGWNFFKGENSFESLNNSITPEMIGEWIKVVG